MAVPTLASTSSEPGPQPQLQIIASSQYNKPGFDFLDDTKEAMNDYRRLCVPLHKLALKGNWAAAKRILDQDERLRYAALTHGWPTVLHVAAAENHFHFVDQLLKLMKPNDIHIYLSLQDSKGNTAFCFAAAAGNLKIVQLMLDRNRHLPKIRGGDGLTPLHFAALQGRCQMTRFLYDLTIDDNFKENDWNLLFFTCINTGIYDQALKMIEYKPELAFARDENNETGLHLLAQKPLDSCCQSSQRFTDPDSSSGNFVQMKKLVALFLHKCGLATSQMKHDVVLQLISCLWDTILTRVSSKSEINSAIREPHNLIFDAAEVGNFEFLSELISSYPNLIWETDSRNRSIIHIAVSHRHASIYNLIHEIVGYKDIFVTYVEKEEKNTLLHMAAKSAPQAQLDLVSGAAFQMSLELLWFEEVRKLMPPTYIKMTNSEGLTARALFSSEHAELRKNAEDWMKKTAESCMLISTVIATGVFSAAISNLPGGIDNNGKPNFLDKPSFLIFAISDATAFISSSTAVLIFLSILISRYAEYDFYKSLPLKLICGLVTLFISITSMMIAFGSTFFITYYYGLKWIPDSISILAFLPVPLFIFLQFPLWSDIIYSTYYCRSLFKPVKNMLVMNDPTVTT